MTHDLDLTLSPRVLRLVHERPATLSGSRDRLPGRLWLIPVRGYAAVGARAALGDAGGGDLGDDVVNVRRRRLDEAGADDVADGAHADGELAHFLMRARRDEVVDRQPLAGAAHSRRRCGAM